MSDELPVENADGKLHLETALSAAETGVEQAARSVARLVGTMRTWRKACTEGNVGNMERMGASAEQLVRDATEAIQNAQQSWDFDTVAYLESSAWRQEVMETARDRYGLRVIEDPVAQQLLSAPVAVQAVSGRRILRIGRTNWPNLRPSAVASELKRLRDRLSGANSQEFLEALYAACKRESEGDRLFITARAAYDLFCFAPGYRKEMPPAAFGLMLYALHRSGIKTTRDGKLLHWDWPSGKVKERDVFRVRGDDGQLLSYWGLHFQ